MRLVQWIRGSLPVRAGLAVMLIAILALGSAVSAGMIAWLSEDDAAAINTAGSLRMATYRLAWKLEAQAAEEDIQTLGRNFQHRLESVSLTRILQGEAEAPLNHAYAELRERWRTQLLPALERGDASGFQENADDFVSQLDRFVLLLQHQGERKQS